MSSSTNNLTETLFRNSRPETSVNSYLNSAVKGLAVPHKEIPKRIALFHSRPNPQRGKEAEKTSISVSTDFSSDIGSKPKLRSCHTPGRLLYPPHIKNKTMESASNMTENRFIELIVSHILRNLEVKSDRIQKNT